MPYILAALIIFLSYNAHAQPSDVPPQGKPDFEKIYNAMDQDGNGVVTKEEAKSFHEKRGERKRGQWKGQKGERGQERINKHGEKRQKPAGFYGQADVNKDGIVSESEALQMHLKKFKEIDINSDGMISQEELKAHHKKRRDMRNKMPRKNKSE